MQTKKYIRTRFGLHDFKAVSHHFWRVAQGVSEPEDVNTLWEVLRVVFGETGSNPPEPNEPEVTIEW